jgi:2-polyprenyl-3-methyl-5-hydroxy-6-metoxy-1,4-benzoquinol methylase
MKRSHYQEKLDPWSSHSLITKRLENLPIGTKILDVGTASGTLGKLVHDKKFLLYGIEPDPHWAEASRPYYKEVVCTTLESVPDEFLHGFDVVVCADVLEHMPFPEPSLRRLVNLQSQNAIFLISMPNVANLWVRLNLLLGHFDYQDRGILDHTHLRFYTMDTLLEMIDYAGLHINDVEVTCIPLNLLNPFFANNPLGIAIHGALFRVTKILPKLLGYQFILDAARKSE